MGASVAKPARLTADEKQLIRSSWDLVMKNRANFSIEIFVRVFQQISGSQEMFEQLVGLSIEQVRADPKMKAHCLRVSAILSTVLLELEDPVVLVEMFRNIARTHFKLGNQLGKEHYDKFGKIFIACLADELGKNFDGRTRAAWTKGYGAVQETLLITKAQLE